MGAEWWHSKRVCSGLSSRAAGSVRAGVAVRVYVPALLSSKYLHQTGNEIIQHPCARTHIHTVWRVRTCLFIERPLIHLSPGRIRAFWDILGPVFLFFCFFTLAFQQHNSFSSTTPPSPREKEPQVSLNTQYVVEAPCCCWCGLRANNFGSPKWVGVPLMGCETLTCDRRIVAIKWTHQDTRI